MHPTLHHWIGWRPLSTAAAIYNSIVCLEAFQPAIGGFKVMNAAVLWIISAYSFRIAPFTAIPKQVCAWANHSTRAFSVVAYLPSFLTLIFRPSFLTFSRMLSVNEDCFRWQLEAVEVTGNAGLCCPRPRLGLLDYTSLAVSVSCLWYCDIMNRTICNQEFENFLAD